MALLENRPDIERSKVVFNYFTGAYMVCKHLIDLGHTKIGFAIAPII